MNLNQFYEDKQTKNQRVKELKEELQANSDKIKELEDKYNKALVNGNEKEADNIFPKITKLKEGIKSDTYKIEKLEKLNKEAIRNNAISTLNHLEKVYNDYENKAKELEIQAKPLEDELIKLFSKGWDLQNEYRDITRKYYSLKDSYDIKNNEYSSNVPGYSTELKIFKNSRIPSHSVITITPSQVGTSKVEKERKERINNLGPNTSIGDYARASRILKQD
ncbi:MAG: hypothetical protein WAO56_01245 [Miniphocaeibacter sp.]|uniref:hypothetical protein n=1 Tax=Miniphocaeibacter sp. TaxID=3100973 RepID=UPI0018425663|nr:hypothetical protein [Gallicola sp.]